MNVPVISLPASRPVTHPRQVAMPPASIPFRWRVRVAPPEFRSWRRNVSDRYLTSRPTRTSRSYDLHPGLRAFMPAISWAESAGRDSVATGESDHILRWPCGLLRGCHRTDPDGSRHPAHVQVPHALASPLSATRRISLPARQRARLVQRPAHRRAGAGWCRETAGGGAGLGC
jgi:hypothetical protein